MSNYEQVKGHMKKMSKFLGLIDRRMTIAYKRRRFNLKEWNFDYVPLLLLSILHVL